MIRSSIDLSFNSMSLLLFEEEDTITVNKRHSAKANEIDSVKTYLLLIKVMSLNEC